MKKDLRSPLAKSRDDFFESHKGFSLCETSILKSHDDRKFLKNRLETAFLAGVETAKRLKL